MLQSPNKRHVLGGVLAIFLSAAMSGQALLLDSVDFAMTGGLPLGGYNEVAKATQGWQSGLNFVYNLDRSFGSFISVENLFWYPAQSYLSFGTGIGVLGGLTFRTVVLAIPKAGELKLGFSLGYGFMAHVVTGTWTGSTSTSGFFDQMGLAEGEITWSFDRSPINLYIKPRYLFASEQKGFSAQELSIGLGLRYILRKDSMTKLFRAVESVSITSVSPTLVEGQSFAFAAAVVPIDATNPAIRWTVDDQKIATIDDSGNLHALKFGDTTIRVRSVDGEKTNTVDVSVKLPLRQIADMTVPSLATGNTLASITNPLTLPKTALDGTPISWKSSDAEIIADDGTVTRPAFSDGDKNLTLKLTTSRDGQSESKEISFTVKALPKDAAAALDEDAKALSVGYAQGDSESSVTANVQLPVKLGAGSSVEWASNSEIIVADGSVARPPFKTGDSTVVLTAKVKKGEAFVDRQFTLIVKAAPMTPMELVELDATGVAITYSDGDTVDTVTQNVSMTTAGDNGSVIIWSSDAPGLVNSFGLVTRPVGKDGLAKLTASVKNGKEASKDVVFALTVLDNSVNVDAAAIAITFAKGDSEQSVTKKLGLPLKGKNGTAISWTSSDEKLLHVADGSVVRINEEDAPVTLTAQVTKNKLVASLEVQVSLAAAKAELDAAALAIGFATDDSADYVSANLSLPATGERGSAVTWTSLTPARIAGDGSVVPLLNKDEKVTLRASLSNGPSSAIRDFVVTVKDGAVAADLAALALGFGSGDSDTSVTKNISLPLKGANGTLMSWTSSNTALLPTPTAATAADKAKDAVIVRNNENDEGVVLSVKVTKGNLREQSRDFTLVLAAAKAELDAAALAIGFTTDDSADYVSANLSLPATGERGSTVTWTSLTPARVGSDGSIVPPLNKDEKVTLRAALSSGPSSATRDFAVTVKDGAIAADLAAIALGFGSGDTEMAVTQKIVLPLKGANGTTITWTSSNTDLFGNDGTIVRTNEADEPVTLAVKISKTGLRDQGKEFQLVLAAAKAELDSAETEIGYASDDSATFVTQNLVLPGTGIRGSTINWSSLSAKALSDSGVLTPPLGQDEKVTLRATLVNGPSRATRDFTVVAKDYSVFADLANLALTFSPSDSENHVTAKLGLPAAGANKTKITWSADQPDLVASNGDVKRPEGRDVKVTLKAVISKADRSTEKTFTANVIDVTMFRITTSIAKQIADKKLQNVSVMETPQGISITAGGLAFGADSGDINKDVAVKLDLLGVILQNLDKNGDLRNAKIVIEGHSAVGSSGKTDNSDAPKSDMTVSKLRAEGVMKYFISRNYVSAAVIAFVGYGSTRPIAEAKDAKNRRVEIIIVKDNAVEEGSK